uniref:ferric-chelate reductase (NADPH) n=1 Tax=Colletotrichum fructicola (strain Nara gc5) TaxID=1213859 RepID=L2GBJ1_COLFN
MSHDHGGSSSGGDMGGMTMGTALFQDTNVQLAKSFWYIIAGVVGFLGIIRGINYLEGRRRLKRCRSESVQFPTRPTSHITQIWATATALAREAGHPQLYIPIKGLRWATPPPLGRVLVLLAYWAVIIYMMAADAVVKDAYFWERIGFRNAWVTIMQMPLVYLLSMKTQLKIMPYIKHGMGAWGLLVWAFVSGVKPVRGMAYEVFVVQHVLSAVIFIWLVYVHIPVYARQYLWFTVALICFDRLARWALLAWQNTRPRLGKSSSSSCKGMKRIGHEVQVRAVGSSTTVLTIKDVHFSWKAGQHLYLWLPRVGPFEAHPYTIACAHQLPETCICNSIQLVKDTLTGFVLGPFGAPPRWDIYETMVLISASTGASFTLPILESIVHSRRRICTTRVDFILMARQGEEIEFYTQRLREAMNRAQEVGLELRVHVAITRSGKAREGEMTTVLYSDRDTSSGSSAQHRRIASDGSEDGGGYQEKGVMDVEKGGAGAPLTPRRSGSSTGMVKEYYSRPDLKELIRDPVEAAGGETSVVVCGGQSLTSSVRNCVAALSDERAVHKGTGAQGIHLFVEEYSF